MSPLTILLAASLAILPQTDGKPAPSATYHDDTLNFTLTYPADYINRATGVIPSPTSTHGLSPETAANVKNCVSIPLAGVKPIGKLFAMVMISKLDLACGKLPLTSADLPDFSAGVMNQSLSRHGKAEFLRPIPYKLGSYDAIYLKATVDESARVPGQILRAGLTCASMHKSMVCWQVIGYDAATFESLEALPLSIDGAPTQPLMPEAFRKSAPPAVSK